MRDHIVNVPDEESCDEAMAAQTGVLNDLLLHRDAVCLPNTPPADGCVLVGVAHLMISFVHFCVYVLICQHFTGSLPLNVPRMYRVCQQ